MVNNLKYVAIFSILIIASAFSQNNNGKKTFDERFVGVWSGAEKDNQVKGLQKRWEMHRKSDGTYKIDFMDKYFDDEDNLLFQDETSEVGNWWIVDSLYYEKSKFSKKPDVYTFEVVDENHIIFRAKELNSEFENADYNFVDTRVIK